MITICRPFCWEAPRASDVGVRVGAATYHTSAKISSSGLCRKRVRRLWPRRALRKFRNPPPSTAKRIWRNVGLGGGGGRCRCPEGSPARLEVDSARVCCR